MAVAVLAVPRSRHCNVRPWFHSQSGTFWCFKLMLQLDVTLCGYFEHLWTNFLRALTSILSEPVWVNFTSGCTCLSLSLDLRLRRWIQLSLRHKAPVRCMWIEKIAWDIKTSWISGTKTGLWFIDIHRCFPWNASCRRFLPMSFAQSHAFSLRRQACRKVLPA